MKNNSRCPLKPKWAYPNDKDGKFHLSQVGYLEEIIRLIFGDNERDIFVSSPLKKTKVWGILLEVSFWDACNYYVKC